MSAGISKSELDVIFSRLGNATCEVMGDFDFVRCVVEDNRVYCTDADGDVYTMPLPEKIPVTECPACVIKKLLAKEMNRGAALHEL
jgi:hypothetical protein